MRVLGLTYRKRVIKKTYVFKVDAFYPDLVLPDRPAAYVHKVDELGPMEDV